MTSVSGEDVFEFYVYPREVDATKRISLANLGACVLDSAGLAAAKRGFGMNDMHARGTAWVVNRMVMEILEMPAEYETIYITTWIESITAVASMRNFLVHRAGGQLLVKVSTLWSVIDFKTRKLVNLLDAADLSGLTVNRNDDKAIMPMPVPVRIDISSGLEMKRFQHTVVYSDIDMNRHTSSMRYLQWALNTIPLTYLSETKIGRVDINFTKETLFGEQISIDRGITDNGFVFDIRNEEGQGCCKIRLTKV